MLQGPVSAALLGSSQRPIPLRTRDDLVGERIVYRGVGWQVVKDPCSLRYYRLQPEQYSVLRLLDGQRSLEDVRDELQREHPTVHVSLQDVQVLVMDLHEKRLVTSERLGQGESLIRQRHEQFWKKFWQTVRNPLYLRLPGWDPDRLLTRMLPCVRWALHPWAVGAALLFIAASWVFLAVRFDDVRQRLPEFQQFFAWPNLLYLWLTLAGTKVLHEFGHGLVCKHFGRECHSMGVMLLVFSPTLYCDVTDEWMLKPKWPRIAIGAAGMYVEVVLAAVAIFAWWQLQPGLLQHLCLNVFFVSTVTTVIFNANPLLRFDGYYMLADFLEIPNLQAKASRLLQKMFAWWCLGIDLRDDAFMPTSGRGWFILYAVAAAAYRCVVLFGIALFLYTVLKPYRLESIGVALGFVSIGSVLLNLGWNVVRILRMPRTEPMSRRKLTVSLALGAALLGAALFVPVPWYLEAPFYVEPEHVQHVYTTVPGLLRQTARGPGQQVAAGELIAVLENPELEDRVFDLQVEEQAQRVEEDVYRAQGDPDRRLVAQQRLHTIVEQCTDAERQQAELLLRAPVAGMIVAPPRTAVPKLEPTRERLPLWSGIPLDPRNAGCFLEQQTHVCSIAPTDRFQAVLLIDQADRADVSEGTTVRMKLEHRPDLLVAGAVAEISHRHLEHIPPALSNKYDGPLPTVTDPQGREKLSGIVYRATVPLEMEPDLLRTGMRGKARLLVARRSAGDWIWRWIRTTFKFRL